MDTKKVIIGITMGDPAGIGPEIIVRSWLQQQCKRDYLSLVIGSCNVLKEVVKRLNISPHPYFHPVSSPLEIGFDSGMINVLDLNNITMSQVKIGKPTAACGHASIEYIEKAIELCQEGTIQAMVTAPINKESLHMAGLHLAGHTELLAERTKTTDYAMMLAGGNLRVALVTTHVALAKVPGEITQDRVYRTIALVYQWLKAFYPNQTNIAVCGLNPHAGENGLFGQEEIESIVPAIDRARSEQIPVEGPFPPDTLFYKAQRGVFGAVVVMYHDQGLIPLKMLAFDTGVNITLGLPIIRTSVDHGTAYDIAWQGKAKTSSLMAAIDSAVYLAGKKCKDIR